MEFLFPKMNLISLANIYLQLSVMMKMIWSLDYITYSSSLTRIALLVCSEFLITLGHNGGELLFSGKECNKVTFLLTTPSTVMESPFFTVEIARALCL